MQGQEEAMESSSKEGEEEVRAVQEELRLVLQKESEAQVAGPSSRRSTSHTLSSHGVQHGKRLQRHEGMIAHQAFRGFAKCAFGLDTFDGTFSTDSPHPWLLQLPSCCFTI